MAANEDHTIEAGGEEQAPGLPLQVDPTNPFAVPENLIEVLKATAPRRPAVEDADDEDEDRREEEAEEADADTPRPSASRRRRKRRRGAVDMELEGGEDGDPENTVTRVRAPRSASSAPVSDTVQGVKGSTRLEAKRQRRRDSRTGGRRRTVITEAEFLARRESVDRKMLVRQRDSRIQIAVLEDGVLAEHFVSNTTQDSLIGNVYLGKVQNVLPSMEAAFVDIGRGRNAVLYAGEVNWDAAQLEGKPKKIENALKSGDTVLVQVTKDPVGHKGARLTSQISLPGRYLVYVPGGSMTGISRKLPDVERARLKRILKDHLPQDAGVIVRTAAEGTSEQELQNDINRLRAQWEGIQAKAASTKVLAPEMLSAEPDLTIKTVRDVFNEDFSAMLVQGEDTWDGIEAYVTYVAPHLLDRLHHWVPEDHDGEDLYATHRVDEQLHKALDRKVYLPSGGSLVIDRTEAMTVVDVNTGKFTGSGGNLEETVTKNNLEAAEEIVRQLRLRDIGGIIVIDFIDMVLEANRDLVLRRLVECLGRDRTKHQVAEVTSLGLVQMTRKRMGTGLVEVFSETCEHCAGRGILIHDAPVERGRAQSESRSEGAGRRRRRRGAEGGAEGADSALAETEETSEEERLRRERAAAARAALRSIVKATVKTEEPAEGEEREADNAAPEAVQTAADAEGAPEEGERRAEDAADEEQGGRRRRRRGRRRGRGRGEDAARREGEAESDAEEVDAVVEEAESAVEAALAAEAEDRTADQEADLAGRDEAAEDRDAAEAGRRTADAEAALEDDVAPADPDDRSGAEEDEAERRGSRRGRRRRGGRGRSRRAESEAHDGVSDSREDDAAEAERPAEPVVAPTEPDVEPETAAVVEPEVAPAVITLAGEPVAVPRRRRGPRRATSDGAVVTAPAAAGLQGIEAALDRRAAGAAAGEAVDPEAAVEAAPAHVARAEDAPVAEPADVTLVEARSEAPAAEPQVVAAAPEQASAAPARRRSRRAVSSDGRQVQVQEAAGAAAGSRFTAAAGSAPAPAPEAGAQPVMLGVGVKAADLARR